MPHRHQALSRQLTEPAATHQVQHHSLLSRTQARNRAGHEPVVIVSLNDYQSLKETAYLLRSPENARRLVTAIERLEAGHGIQRDLAE